MSFPVNLGQFVYHRKVASFGFCSLVYVDPVPNWTDRGWFLLAESAQLCYHLFPLNPWLSTQINTESVRPFRLCLCRILMFMWTCGALPGLSQISFFWSAQVVLLFPYRYKANTVWCLPQYILAPRTLWFCAVPYGAQQVISSIWRVFARSVALLLLLIFCVLIGPSIMGLLGMMGDSFGCSATGERLVSAARDGDIQEARALLELNPRLARYSTFGIRNSPLHYSAAKGHHEVNHWFIYNVVLPSICNNCWSRCLC